MKNNYVVMVLLMLFASTTYSEEAKQESSEAPKEASAEKSAESKTEKPAENKKSEPKPSCIQQCINGFCACKETLQTMYNVLTDLKRVNELQQTSKDLTEKNKTLEEEIKSERQRTEQSVKEHKDLLQQSLAQAKEKSNKEIDALAAYTKSNERMATAQEKSNELAVESNYNQKIAATAQVAGAVAVTGYVAVKTGEIIHRKLTSSTKERIELIQEKEDRIYALQVQKAKRALYSCLSDHIVYENGQYDVPILCEELLVTYLSMTSLNQLKVVSSVFKEMQKNNQ